jgi:hypothetical protein
VVAASCSDPPKESMVVETELAVAEIRILVLALDYVRRNLTLPKDLQ